MRGVTIHHSASHDVSALEIDRWHKQRGWKGVGYHFVIRKDGTIEMGRPWNETGAHHFGFNAVHFGICVTGHFGEYSPTSEQVESCVLLVKGLVSRFGIKEIVGHHEQCPGDKFPLNEIKRRVFGD